MKRLILPSLALILIGCGPSDQEKQETAIITCNIMGETLNMDAADRIREINSARESIGEDAFLGTDSDIKEAFEYGLCQELVLNDPNYDGKLSNIKEQERIALGERLEAERIAREEREEAERIAYQKNQQEYTDSILSVFEEYPPSYSFITNTFTEISNTSGVMKSSGYFDVIYNCINSLGLVTLITVEFKDDLGTITTLPNYIGSCSEYGRTLSAASNAEIHDLLVTNTRDFIESIEKITIEWDGGIYMSNYEDNFSTAVEKRNIRAKVDSDNFSNVVPDLSRLPHTWVIYEKE